MRHYIKNFLIKILSPKLKDKLKRKINNVKQKYPKIIRFVNGSFTTSDLIKEIDSKVSKEIEVLMFHTSLDNMKPMYQGNVTELLDCLTEYCSKRSITLILPGFVLGKNNRDIKGYYLRKKKFDLNRTPTTVGLINECFRRRKNVKRSIHPSHSLLALGPKADEIVANHHKCGSTFGAGSPFHNLEKYSTLIIGLGTYYYRNLTHVHVAEDLLGDSFSFPLKPSHEIVPVEIILREGNVIYDLKVFNKKLSHLRNLNMLHKYLSKEALKQYTFKGMPIFVAKPQEVTDTLLSLVEKGITIYNS